jgi:propionyl-CoA carboxylase alpha chain
VNTYTVHLAGSLRTVVLENDGTLSIRESGASLRVARLSPTELSVACGHSVVRVVAIPEKDGIRVSTRGHALTVIVESEQSRLMKQLMANSRHSVGRKDVVAPMPALVVRLEVEEGQEVKVGQGLLVLEAMKMENEIRSHHEGRIREIRVQPGKTVEKGELLILFE